MVRYLPTCERRADLEQFHLRQMQAGRRVTYGFTYTVTQVDDSTVVNLFGELDLASAPELATGYSVWLTLRFRSS